MEEAVVLPLRPAPDAIELRHLRACVAVAEQLNVSRGLLLCPWIDLPGTSREPQRGVTPLIVDPEQTAAFAAMYLAGHDPDDPLVAPLGADLTGLPPLLVQAGTGDDLVQEARLLAERGASVELEPYPVVTHDFHLFWTFLPEAADALGSAGDFLAAADPAQAQEA